MEATVQQTTTAPTATPQTQVEKKTLWQLLKQWPLRRKLMAAAVLAVTLGLFLVLIIQSRVADHQLLYANLTETDASSVVNWLRGQRIPYHLENGGKNIWIPADKLYEARLDLAAGGLPSGGGVGFEIFDKQSFALTDYVQKVNYTRALQGELARTITSLDPVEAARVHVALPEKRLFKEQQKEATASVIITLGQGRALDNSQVKGIVHLVAGSVAGLKPENVKVIDSNGVVLKTKQTNTDEQMLSVNMLRFQRELESRLESQAQTLLNKTMGQGKAMVRVSATLNFAKVEKTQELFDAEEPVIRSEQITTQSATSNGSGGIPGVQSNLEGNLATTQSTTPEKNSSSRITNYEISKTIAKIVNPIGTISKLSVSVLVAHKAEKDPKSGKVTLRSHSDQELTDIKEMVATAIGFVADRGDKISIVSMPFIDPPKAEQDQSTTTAQAIYQYIPLLKIALIPIAALFIYLLLIRPLLKTMRTEVTEHYKSVEEMQRLQYEAVKAEQQPSTLEEIKNSPPEEQLLSLRKNINKNPTQATFIIKNWLAEG